VQVNRRFIRKGERTVIANLVIVSNHIHVTVLVHQFSLKNHDWNFIRCIGRGAGTHVVVAAAGIAEHRVQFDILQVDLQVVIARLALVELDRGAVRHKRQ